MTSRRDRLRSALRSQRAGAIVGMLGAVLFLCGAVVVADRDAKLGHDAPTAEAVVVDVFRGRTSSVVVDFTTADGQRVRAETEDWYWDPEPEVGDSARVRYDPVEPAEYVRDDRLGGSTWFVVLLGVVSATFLAVGVLGWRHRLPTWLLH